MYRELNPASQAAIERERLRPGLPRSRGGGDPALARRRLAGGPAPQGRETVVPVPSTSARSPSAAFEADLELPYAEGGIAWDPSLVFPGLRPGEHLENEIELAPRAPILAADGTPLAEGPAEAREHPLGSAAIDVTGEIGGRQEEVVPAELGRSERLGSHHDSQYDNCLAPIGQSTGATVARQSGRDGNEESGMATATSVDEYLAGLAGRPTGGGRDPPADDPRGCPGCDRDDRVLDAGVPQPWREFLVSYAAYKTHYSLFPASGVVVEVLGDEIAPCPGRQGNDPVSGRSADPGRPRRGRDKSRLVEAVRS